MEFWYRYKSLARCRDNPCLNGGVCSVDRQEYVCTCPPRYIGQHCETEVFECEYKNGGCLHYCSNSALSRTSVNCSCAEGYELESDGKSCKETVKYPCGKQWSQGFLQRSLLDDLNQTHTPFFSNHTHLKNGSLPEIGDSENSGNRIVGGQLQKQGGSPWQVLLRKKDESGFCGGTLIKPRWVVTAAHCLQEAPDHVTIGDYDKFRVDEGEQKISVKKVVVHPHFHEFTFDSDVALLFLAQEVELSAVASPVCLPDTHLSRALGLEGQRGVVSGWGATSFLGRSSRFLRKVTLPVVSQEECMRTTDQLITDNMFCAGFLEADSDACTGDSGGPFVVNFRGTVFLTGVVSWGEGCAAKGKFGVYTRLGNFLPWIQDEMRKQEEEEVSRTKNTGQNSTDS
ncbi:coagulation factor X isoform X2 [Hoplias malabaricus]